MATTYIPPRENSMAALAVANAVRSANAQTCRYLGAMRHAEGLRYVAKLLRDDDLSGPLASMPIGRLLYAIRGMGEGKAESTLRLAQVFQSHRPLRRLTMRQRGILAESLERRARITNAR
jgi:hypothetical protein